MNPLLLAAAAKTTVVLAAAASAAPQGAFPHAGASVITIMPTAGATAAPHIVPTVQALPKIPQAAPTIVPAPPPAPMPQTWFQLHASWLTHGLAGLFIICAILLIVLLALQTTKQEGLSGSIGGRVEGAYRGRLGAEEQLKRITGIVAVCFVVFGLAVSLTGI